MALLFGDTLFDIGGTDLFDLGGGENLFLIGVPVGPVVCDYVKAFTNPRQFVTDIDGNYVVASGCSAAPEQEYFTGVPGISAIVPPGRMKAIHPPNHMTAKLD